MASKGPMSMVSMLSKSIFATMPKVKIAMATVPEKVPREKMSAQTSAMIRVGRVRISARIKRKKLTSGRLRLMLLEERIATGSARTQPMTVPRTDILMVSMSGETTFGKNSQFGWKILASRSSILLNLCMTTAISKPVILSESHMASASSTTISGARLRRRRTEWPFARVMTWGLKILSYRVSL